MSKPLVYVTRPIPEAGLKLIHETCDVRMWEGDLPVPRDTLLEEIKEVDGLYSLLTEKIDKEVMAAGRNLKVISNMAVGYDNVDVPAATQRKIPVGNTPGVLTETSADFAFALLMSAARRLSEAEHYVKAGKWQTWSPTLLLGHDIHQATLGIIGLGRIGQAVARRARGFSMRILYHGGSDEAAARHLGAEKVSLEQLLGESDFISVHTPLNEATRGFISTEEFKLMKSNAILINTARGPVVDPDALFDALSSQKIFAAALDVTDPEPIPADHPLVSLDNCLIVPHLASASFATRNKMAEMAAQNLLAGLRGEHLPNCVNPEIYENDS